MTKVIVGIFAVTLLVAPLYAEDAKLGRDDFLTNAISDVVGKVDEYATGKKDILTPDAKGMDDRNRYEEDPLGRKIPDAIKPLKRPAATK